VTSGPVGGLALARWWIGRSGVYALCRPTQPQRREQAPTRHHAPKPTSFARHVPPVGPVSSEIRLADDDELELVAMTRGYVLP